MSASQSFDAMTPGVPGATISIAAQSGALSNSIALCLRKYGIGLSQCVPVGDEPFELLDAFEHLIEDEAAGIIGLVVENIADGTRLRALAARACEAGKPVIALKLGRSQAGAELIRADSSSARACEALFSECAIALAPCVESFAGAAALLLRGQDMLMSGDTGLVCMAISRAGGALLADHAEDRGVPLAGEDGLWRGKAAKAIASFEGAGPIRNPIDGGNLMGWSRLAPLLESIEAEGQSGPVLLYADMLPEEADDLLVADILLARMQRTGAPLAVLGHGWNAPLGRCALSRKRRSSFLMICRHVLTPSPTFYDSVEFDADDLVDPPDERSSIGPQALVRIREILASVEPGDFLAEYESAQALALAGVPMTQSALATSPDEADGCRSCVSRPRCNEGADAGRCAQGRSWSCGSGPAR